MRLACACNTSPHMCLSHADCSPAHAESLSTLKFAHRAKNIRNSASVNEDVDQRTLLRKYERELKRLRTELQQRQAQVVDKRQLLAVRSTGCCSIRVLFLQSGG